ncbi:hypothetical protein M9H77_06341 [Catharanthus roseus]|uniref:Uncharacterized protein n=1 Tax=Catharanthus roseus TaxID=4058 RepID=A0ACC0BRS7_CATRO|nr:hypothetical protein M9H77_06341 [Catharanthus roseus]
MPTHPSPTAFFSPPNTDVPLKTALPSLKRTLSQPPPTAILLSPVMKFVSFFLHTFSFFSLEHKRIISRVSVCLVLSIEVSIYLFYKYILIHIELYVFRDHEEYIMSRRNGRTPSPYILGNIDVEKEVLALQVPATNVIETRGADVTCIYLREVKKQKKTKFASIVPENMKLVYLRQSVINEVGNIKLQLLGMAREICIDLLQERNFTEEECDALRLKMNSGLFKKLTLNFAKEIRNIEAEIGHTNEKAYKYRYPFIFFSVEILPQCISGRFDFNLIISQIKGFIISNDTRDLLECVL